MHALFYTLLLMARGCLPFNGTNFAPSHASQPASHQSVGARSPTTLTFFTFPLGNDGWAQQQHIVDSSTSQQFFF